MRSGREHADAPVAAQEDRPVVEVTAQGVEAGIGHHPDRVDAHLLPKSTSPPSAPVSVPETDGDARRAVVVVVQRVASLTLTSGSLVEQRRGQLLGLLRRRLLQFRGGAPPTAASPSGVTSTSSTAASTRPSCARRSPRWRSSAATGLPANSPDPPLTVDSVRIAVEELW